MSRLAVLAAPLILSACAAVSSITGTAPSAVYELRAPADVPRRATPAPVEFVVETPQAAGAIDTDRILIRPSSTEVSYLPEVRWAEEAPLMIQSALVEAFERAGAYRYVGRRPISASADVALLTNLIDFEAEVTGDDRAEVTVTLVARLVREQDAAILANARFSSRMMVASTGTENVVAGYEQATRAVIRDLLRWALARGLG